MRIRALVAALLLAPAVCLAGPRDFIIYAPGMGGTQAQAKPYLETFFRYLEKAMAWPTGSANGAYFEDRAQAVDYITKTKPGFGMLSPPLFLDLACKNEKVEPIAAVVGLTGTKSSGRYHVVVKQGGPASLEALKGKKLSSNHLQDTRFVSQLVFGGKLDVEKYFQLDKTSSPIKPFKAVDRGEADAALVDDAQLEHMKSLPFGQSLQVVYSSEPLPPFPVVAFGKVVKPGERDAFKKAITGMCDSKEGAPVCKSLQITRFEPLDAAAYKAAEKAYCSK